MAATTDGDSSMAGGDTSTSYEPGQTHYIGLAATEGYDQKVADKWATCCTVLDNLISFDGTGEIEAVSLVSILESVNITEGLDEIMQAVASRAEITGEPKWWSNIESELQDEIKSFLENKTSPTEELILQVLDIASGSQTQDIQKNDAQHLLEWWFEKKNKEAAGITGPLTKKILENNLFAKVQEMPDIPIEKVFEEAIHSKSEHQTILIIGLLGRGKSALSQYLVSGIHDAEDKNTFVSGDMGMSGGGVTTDFWVGHFPFLGDGAGKDRWVTVIDTPGGNDEKLPNFENFKRLQSVVKGVRFINTILLVVSSQDIMRRTESLNTYLHEFALMLQQDKLCNNVAVIISRGHMAVPAFFPSEERFAHALEESIMNPLREAFGGEVPCYRLSLSKLDYLADPSLEFKVKETAVEIYEKFLEVKPLDCQKMVSLETRIKRLIHQHVALEEDHKNLQKEHEKEVATHKETQQNLDTTTENLEKTTEELERTSTSLKDTKEDLDRWRDKHSQCFSMLKEETERHEKTREQLDTEREQHRETQEKWTKEVADHHDTQGRLETEIRNHRQTRTDLEDKEQDLEKTLKEMDSKDGELRELRNSSKSTAEELAAAEKAKADLAEKLRKKGSGMCIIS